MNFTKNNETRPHPREVRMIINKDFSKSNFKDDVSKMKVYENKLSEQNEESGRQEEGVVMPEQELKVQKSRMIVNENEALPEESDKNIRRKLIYDE